MDEVKKAATRASAEDWLALESACSLLRLPSSAFARCLIDLRDCFLDELRPRVAALEAAAQSTPAADSTAAPGARSVITGVNTSAYPPGTALLATPALAAAPAGGVTLAEVTEVMEEACNQWTYGGAARCLLNHPRIGPLLCGEGGKRVALAEEPPAWLLPFDGRRTDLANLVRHTWTAARAEVARQQGEA